MTRIYEELFIIRPDATDEEITPIVEQIRGVITNAAGTVDKEERWGVRKLAYRVQKRNEGFYVLLQFTSDPQTVREIERRLRVNDNVLKFLTVRIDEKLKKIEKRRRDREKRAARRPAPAAAAPAAPAEPIMPAAPAPAAPMPGAPVTEEK
jgi:small subunit ribosomal protein S6